MIGKEGLQSFFLVSSLLFLPSFGRNNWLPSFGRDNWQRTGHVGLLAPQAAARQYGDNLHFTVLQQKGALCSQPHLLFPV